MILFLAVEATMDVNRSRRLNLDAPLLSTKRHVSEGKVSEASPSERIPFCWETAPGLPKNLSLKKDEGFSTESETPRLKLPPGRLKVNFDGDGNGRNKTDNETSTPAKSRLKKRTTHEDLHQINYEDSNHDAVSEAVDALSLTQAIDIFEHQRTPKRSVSESDRRSGGGGDDDSSNGYLTIETTERSSDLSDPSYIIERFLPDAAALAAVTSAAKKPGKNIFGYLWSGQNKRSAVASAVRQTCFSPKGCGLHVLLPTWGAKHRICGVKNAFSPCSHVDLQPRFSPKEK